MSFLSVITTHFRIFLCYFTPCCCLEMVAVMFTPQNHRRIIKYGLEISMRIYEVVYNKCHFFLTPCKGNDRYGKFVEYIVICLCQ